LCEEKLVTNSKKNYFQNALLFQQTHKPVFAGRYAKKKKWFKDILSCKIHYLFTIHPQVTLACMTFFILQNTKVPQQYSNAL